MRARNGKSFKARPLLRNGKCKGGEGRAKPEAATRAAERAQARIPARAKLRTRFSALTLFAGKTKVFPPYPALH